MLEDTLDPLCIIVVKSGAEGGKLIFKVHYSEICSHHRDCRPKLLGKNVIVTIDLTFRL